MTFKFTYCHACRCNYIRDDGHFATPCGHPRRDRVAVDYEIIGCYEQIHLRLGGTGGGGNASGFLWPDGEGGTLVLYNRCLISLAKWTAWVADKSPTMLAAFEARRGLARRSAT